MRERSPNEAHLNELDKTEFRDLIRRLCPTVTDEEFEERWLEFVELKRLKEIN